MQLVCQGIDGRKSPCVFLFQINGRVGCGNRAVRRRRCELADMFGTAVARDEQSVGFGRAVFARDDISVFVDVDEVFESGVVGDLPYRDKHGFYGQAEFRFIDGIFKNKPRKFAAVT